MELFWQATTIMVLGMGLVFLFLFGVILAVQGVAVVLRRYAPAEEEAGSPAGGGGPAGTDGDALVAAIAAALHSRGRG
jgi:sodium pump decarboxylase gamma subunit